MIKIIYRLTTTRVFNEKSFRSLYQVHSSIFTNILVMRV